MKRHYWVGVFCGCFLIWMFVHAETGRVPLLPSTTEPGLISKRLQNTKITPTKPLPTIRRPQVQEAKPTSAEEKIKLTLTHVSFKGNTAFTSDKLEAIFKPYYNKTISLADLQALVEQVTTLYRSSGYVLSRAILPPQTIKKGSVQVQIIEGYVSKLKIEGHPGRTEPVLMKYASSVLQSRPLQIQVLEKDMLIMNDIPGVTVKAVLTPSKNIPGSADLTLVADLKGANAYISYDNYGTRYIGPQEIGAGVTINSAFFAGASDTFRVMTVPQTDELEYLEYDHTHPIGSHGAKLTFSYNYSNTNAGYTLSDFNVVGRSNMLYADIYYPLIRSRTKNLFLHSTFNYDSVSSTILGTEFYSDLIRSLVVGGEYSAIDHWHGANDIKLDMEKGFDIFGAHKHLLQSRPKGVPNYLKFDLMMSRLQILPWQLSLLGAIRGQTSCDPLLATEQFAYGGADWGRGYDPSEIVGDDGLAAKLELRRDSVIEKRWLNTIQYYAFYDAGLIWNRDGINLPAKQTATSTGIGARFVFIPQLTGNLFVAKPLTHSVSTQVVMGKYPFPVRGFFQLVATF